MSRTFMLFAITVVLVGTILAVPLIASAGAVTKSRGRLEHCDLYLIHSDGEKEWVGTLADSSSIPDGDLEACMPTWFVTVDVVRRLDQKHIGSLALTDSIGTDELKALAGCKVKSVDLNPLPTTTPVSMVPPMKTLESLSLHSENPYEVADLERFPDLKGFRTILMSPSHTAKLLLSAPKLEAVRLDLGSDTPDSLIPILNSLPKLRSLQLPWSKDVAPLLKLSHLNQIHIIASTFKPSDCERMDIPQLSKLNCALSLEFYGNMTLWTNDKTWSQIAGLTNLVSLSVSDSSRKLGAEHLQGLTAMPDTTRISMHLSFLPLTTDVMASISKIKGLDELFLLEPAVEDKLFQVGLPSGLKKLVITAGNAPAFGRLDRYPERLPRYGPDPLMLSEANSAGVLGNTTLLAASKCAGLRVLKLRVPKADRTGLDSLKNLKHLVFLGLDLADSSLSKETCDSLAALPALQSLNLSSSTITDAGLNRLKGAKRLRVLDLTHTNITDVGAAHLAAYRSLQELSLRDTKISVAALKSLSKLKTLRFLELSGTSIDAAAKNEIVGLFHAIPGIKLHMDQLDHDSIHSLQKLIRDDNHSYIYGQLELGPD